MCDVESMARLVGLYPPSPSLILSRFVVEEVDEVVLEDEEVEEVVVEVCDWDCERSRR
jgi:hypothetical protein